jgi:hypothetical protein
LNEMAADVKWLRARIKISNCGPTIKNQKKLFIDT